MFWQRFVLLVTGVVTMVGVTQEIERVTKILPHAHSLYTSRDYQYSVIEAPGAGPSFL